MGEFGEVIPLFGRNREGASRADGERRGGPTLGATAPSSGPMISDPSSDSSRRSIRDSAGASELQELLRATREARQRAIADAQHSIAQRSAASASRTRTGSVDVEHGDPQLHDVDRPDARIVAQRALARRSLSEAEVRAKLISADVDPDDLEVEIARLIDQRIIDDVDLAQRLTEQLSDRKKLGRSGISRALKERKIDADAIDQALDTLPDDSEIDNALDLAERKARSLQSLDFEVAQRRLWGHLQRKGFSSSVIKVAVQAALGDGRR